MIKALLSDFTLLGKGIFRPVPFVEKLNQLLLETSPVEQFG